MTIYQLLPKKEEEVGLGREGEKRRDPRSEEVSASSSLEHRTTFTIYRLTARAD